MTDTKRTVLSSTAWIIWFLGLLGLLALLGLSGCSRVLGIEEATLRPGTGGVSGGAAGGGAGGPGGTAGSAGVPGGGGAGATLNCPIGTVNLNGQCCTLPVAGGACNLPACGCAEGQVCGVDKPATGLQCVAEAGVALGQSCSGQSCVAGAGCFGGMCKPYCQTDGDCAAIAGLRYCRATIWSSTGETIPGVNVCAVMCDPTRPQSPRAPLRACPSGYRCWFSNDSRYSDCTTGGTAVAGQPCPNGNECSPGHYCTVRSVCNRTCSTAADCATGEGCLEFSTPVSFGGLKVGYCGNCDPVRPDAPRTGLYGCPTGYTCAYTTGKVFECLKSKTLGVEGDPCPNLHTDCKPGYYCTSASAGTCHRYCADATDCGGTSCNDFSPPLTPSGQRVGFCPMN